MNFKTFLLITCIVVGFVLIGGCTQQAYPKDPKEAPDYMKNISSKYGHFNIVWNDYPINGNYLGISKVKITEDNITCYMLDISTGGGISCLRD